MTRDAVITCVSQPGLQVKGSSLVRCLGYAGLIPFVLLAPLNWMLSGQAQSFVSTALVGYAALIASFLGGIHWGIVWVLACSPTSPPVVLRPHLLWGVTPSLLAWPGLFMPAFASLVWLGFVLILCYLVDRTLYLRTGLQTWLALRWRLSVVASVSCFVTAGAI